MSRTALILLLSWAYVGCAGQRCGVIRILPASESERLALQEGLTRAGRSGPGPFLDDGTAGLIPNPDYAGRGPYVQEVRFVGAGQNDPGLILRLGEADLAVLYGRSAGRLIDDEEPSLRMGRAPGWDRTYFLWLGTRRRWVNDPLLRRWLAGALEREPLLRFLFDGRGSVAHSLSSPARGLPARPRPSAPPFGRDTRPRLSLRFDGDDRHARSIAARIKAVLDSRGLELTLVPRGPRELADELRSDGLELALLAHHANGEGALDALSRTLERLGRERLPRAVVRQAELDLLAEARLVPLVRLDAWLARAHGLRGVRAGSYGVLGLESARWRR